MDQKISKVMTTDPRVVYPGTPLTRVLQDMIDTGHKSFTVVENDVVVGIVAREYIIRALRQSGQAKIPARLIRPDLEGLALPHRHRPVGRRAVLPGAHGRREHHAVL